MRVRHECQARVSGKNSSINVRNEFHRPCLGVIPVVPIQHTAQHLAQRHRALRGSGGRGARGAGGGRMECQLLL